jgi:hypothetical protein
VERAKRRNGARRGDVSKGRMTNEEYLRTRGWEREGMMVFCWLDPETKSLNTESQAMHKQAVRERARSK